MKNMKKLVALFAATVMTMSLSVSAFAATVETTVGADEANISDEAFNLVFAAPTGGETDIDQLTMIAYLVPDTTTLETWVPYSSQPIVAINQVDGDAGFGTVPVDVAKLTDGNAIAVAIGGTDVAAADIYRGLVTYNKATQTIDFTYGDVTGDHQVKLADYNAVKVYVSKGAHPKFTDIGTEAAPGYVYGDVTADTQVKLADYNAIKVYVSKGSHPKFTDIGTTVQVQQ